MHTPRSWLVLRAVAVCALGLGAGCGSSLDPDRPDPNGDYFYAITAAGVLCGYSVIDTSLTAVEGQPVMLLEQTVFSLGKLLGMEIDSTSELVYNIDPQTGQFTYHSFDVDQGTRRFTAETRIEGRVARCSTSFGRPDQAVDLPEDILLENTLFFPAILDAFLSPDAQTRIYSIFDVADQEVQKVEYSRVGTETLVLAGEEYDAVKVDKRNLTNGVRVRLWLDSETGLCLKILEQDGRIIFLADSSLASKLERFESDDYILTRTNVSIADVPGVSYMKVRATIRPTGIIVTPSRLNVPGQSFVGTVEENLIEGVFEIQHPRYQGLDAPPFPPEFPDADELAAYTQPSEFIESNDPAIVALAQELTEEATDSWDALRKLSYWVSTEIAYAIPGGGSAKGVLEMKAGECGGHSVLLAALCRAVGIPARMVWGVTYVPRDGGMFGQHGWNEIYMGSVGWVPVDATGSETDFVDSGHIRLGEFESFATYANAKEFEILDYRVLGATEQATAEATIQYEAYLGKYDLKGMPNPSEVRVQDGSLVLDIPGNTALAFDAPDERGRWKCKLAHHVYLVFEETDAGEVIGAGLHELHQLQKTASGEIDDSVPEDLRSCLGRYLFAPANAEFTVRYLGGRLRMHHPLEGRTSVLSGPNLDGGWVSDNDRHTIYFERDDSGQVESLTIDAVSRFRRSSG